jgi:hypothetical protein
MRSSPLILWNYADNHTRRWYNNPDHSDLAIQLSDGRKIHVHKLVLCTNNQYFKRACGVAIQFAVHAINSIAVCIRR